MKIYGVEFKWSEWEGGGIISVHKTRQGAENALKSQKEKYIRDYIKDFGEPPQLEIWSIKEFTLHD